MNWPFMATFKAILIDIDISASNCRYWTDILVDTRLWCMIQVHASTRNSSSTKPIMTIENEPIHRGSKQSKSRQFKFEDLQHKTQLGRSKHELFHKLSVFINPFKTIKHMTNMRSPNSLQKTITVFINLIKTIKHIWNIWQT